jgi:hypothetical protein
MVLLSRHFDWQYFLAKGNYEDVAIFLIAAAAIAWAIRARILRERMALLMTVQALIFTCREIHFRGSDTGVYVGTGIVLIWALAWAWRYHEQLVTERTDWRMLSFLTAAIICYMVSVLIQRRAFKGLPLEADLHIPFEESAENMAHILFFIAAIVHQRRRNRNQ